MTLGRALRTLGEPSQKTVECCIAIAKLGPVIGHDDGHAGWQVGEPDRCFYLIPVLAPRSSGSKRLYSRFLFETLPIQRLLPTRRVV